MERNENGLLRDDTPPFNYVDQGSVLSSSFFLDHVGEVVLTHDSDGLSWKLVESLHNEEDKRSCLGLKFVSNSEYEVKFADIYAVDFIDWGLVHECALSSSSELMYRFTVHVVQKSKTQSSLWTPSVYTFGHKNSEICKTWVSQINAYRNVEAQRPKNLLVFVHPRSGKGKGCRIWEVVAPLFSQAKVKTKIDDYLLCIIWLITTANLLCSGPVMVTERAGHARDVLASITNRELRLYDGVVAVGGDGFFNEILHGVLLSRHKAPYPPAPGDPMRPVESESNVSVRNAERTILEPCVYNEDESPLLTGSEHIGSQSPNCEQDPEFTFPNETFRFGIIPAGSTDAIAICTTGARDPVTSALHIILGKRVHLDLAQLVRWKTTSASNEEEPCVRYAASFAGYGFYGDVITESEKYRWMGPKRYDYAGTKVFLQHRLYEAEVNYLEVEPEKGGSGSEKDAQDGSRKRWCLPAKLDRVSCRANCGVCNTKLNDAVVGSPSMSAPNLQGLRWSRHLIQLARRGGDPLEFNFVEHHKTPAFTFTSSGKEGVWNVDGELFQAHQLSAQVFRGLVSLFATGPEA
ncbi:hypothetical protein BUALT_Bualt06G0134300 [Buddleja alternifolia]|uniref:DAGKc domain-containing protein n=1 Tax=Buddleja alternifolia TaxID=168488 RepID=A0AAV6XJ80_9LAMI|nr:hypothetical protein BUALT_Bualt06G0134300 [Buddleja alternifolia]